MSDEPEQRPDRLGDPGRPDRGSESVPPTAEQGPDQLRELPGDSWFAAAKRTAKGYSTDNLGDWAAALTYYGVLSIFPGLLLLVTVLRLTGTGTTNAVLDNIAGLAPGSVRDILHSAADNLQHGRQGTAGVIAVASLLGALWSASGYVGAFMRASNAIYDVPEGRPLWKRLPIRLGLTVATGVMLTASAVIVVVTGRLARSVGSAVGIGSTAVTVWNIAKWPVLVAIVALLFDLLFWASPNAEHGGFRWVTPGGTLAVLVWLLASAGFAAYVANFGSYNKTYGSLAAVIVFLVWLWISNLAVLVGAEFDAEIQRGRAIRAGHPPHAEPYLRPRDPDR